MREAAADRAAVAHLAVADALGRRRQHAALLAHELRRRDRRVRRRARRSAARRRPPRSRPSPAIRPMSTSAAGSASRSFIIGRSEWPPASGRVSPFSASSPIASSRLVGRLYSNSAGRCVYMALLSAPRRLHRPPDALRRQRHVEVPDPERRERVHHRVHDRRGRRDRAGLARALDAERVDVGRRLRPVELELRQEVRLRDGVAPSGSTSSAGRSRRRRRPPRAPARRPARCRPAPGRRRSAG